MWVDEEDHSLGKIVIRVSDSSSLNHQNPQTFLHWFARISALAPLPPSACFECALRLQMLDPKFASIHPLVYQPSLQDLPP